MTQKNAYQEKAEAKMDEWQAEIDKIRAKADHATADARIKYDEQIKELVDYQKKAQKQLEDMQRASEAAWADMRSGMEKAWADLSKSWQDAINRYR